MDLLTADPAATGDGGAGGAGAGGAGALTPLDWYLAEQADLSAVERFSRRHDAHALPVQARYYRDLIPLDRPGPGQQYGFEVDLDACTGCKACVTACHALNGLDDGESWRTVGSVHVEVAEPFQQTVTAACHHCVEPACLAGCPVNAYEKDPATGIVAHLDDQCIGCRYCVLTCPYEVPRYNPERGIVRKCDLCADRLEAGEAPACVQSCPNAAIRVSVVDTEAARAAGAPGQRLVPGAPLSSITVPTTRYTSRRVSDGLVGGGPVDVAQPPQRGQAHVPLTVMLVLTQVAVGTSVVGLGVRSLAGTQVAEAVRPASALVALAVGLLALGASVLHLGRPAYAFRAVLGIRRSWLSREIVAFTAFALLAAGHGWAVLAGAGGAEPALGAAAAAAGVVGVACSAQVYAVTRRRWWALPRTALKFALTTVATGAGGVLVVSVATALALAQGPVERAGLVSGRPLGVLVATAVVAKLAWEAGLLRHLRSGAPAELQRSAVLLAGELAPSSRWRFALGLAGASAALAVALGAGAVASPMVLVLAVASFAAVVGGELVERWQFFTAVAPPCMPSALS
ncbi:MAG: dimethyl sulfoxide reductase anchor subunit [Actinomycetota bacterium]|nr:dimethyl sulfoxide reductase anchor subunit [Actinomycetota bacterium]